MIDNFLPILCRSPYNPLPMRDNTINTTTSIVFRLTLAGLLSGILLLAGPWVGEVRAQTKTVVLDDEDEEDKIIGTVHKPEVPFLRVRQEQEDLETLELRESFLPKVIKSVEKTPF